MDLHFKDAPIHDLLRLIADVGKVSIVVPDTINATVTLDLKRVPWDQALEVILSSHELWYRREGNIYRIAPRKELDAEDEDEAERREAAFKAEAPRSAAGPAQLRVGQRADATSSSRCCRRTARSPSTSAPTR